MTPEDKKRVAARAAIEYLTPGSILGVGTGSTVNHFIDLLATTMPATMKAVVSSSQVSTERLQKQGIDVVDLNAVDHISFYIDGTDESNHQLQLIKGGGGALTREKILAEVSDQFICIADDSKLVEMLGSFPLPVEVIPMARAWVTRKLENDARGIVVKWREGEVTDNGNHLLDVSGLRIDEAQALETRINQIPGVVTVGLFAQRAADLLILGGDTGLRILTPT